MHDFDNKKESTEYTPENAEASLSKNEEKNQNQHHEEPISPIQKLNTNKWHQMLNLAETSVQLIANTDGFKTYQSMM